MSKLDPEDSKFRPMYLDNSYMESERQIIKHLGKRNWYEPRAGGGIKKKKVMWRKNLKGIWGGMKPIQRRVKGMIFPTVIQIPSSKGSNLMKALAKIEPTLAKASGYNCKLVEKSGTQLIRLFDRIFKPPRCH